jgi:hypothetical protein
MHQWMHGSSNIVWSALAIEILPELEAPFRKMTWPIGMTVFLSFEDL